MKAYDKFLNEKEKTIEPAGLDAVPHISDQLFNFQSDIVEWALRRGRAAIFADCGLGKTPIQLEWARCVPGNALIVAPLAVSQQTIKEGEKFNVPVVYSRSGEPNGKITITNYEMVHHFNPDNYNAIVLDESSILKSFSGVYRRNLTTFGSNIQYRLCCTATPAPNDLIELTNHAEFLGILTGKEVIALYFIQDGNTTHKWRIKGHAEKDFWRWMASWSVALRKPSDLGYDDEGFSLPALKIHNHIVKVEEPSNGMLFVIEARTMDERRRARRESIDLRVEQLAEIVNGSDGPWVVWCNLNDESKKATEQINGAVEVKGADSMTHKEESLLSFSENKIRCLVTKPKIAGFGMNWQNCSNVAFLGLSDSYEQFYQAVRRCWRFGQKNEVNAHLIIAETEGAVRANIERKENHSKAMMDNIIKNMGGMQLDHTKKGNSKHITDKRKGDRWELMLGDSCERVKEIESESIGLSVFSPPFPGLYAYTDTPRDLGNTRTMPEMIEHFDYLVPELLRITMPGRVCCVHLMQLTSMKSRDGFIGLKDYRGETIKAYQKHGWRYAGEVTIDKNPQVQATRNKERGLLFKTLAKDSSMMRMALADYIIYFRKDGDNPKPIHAGISKRYDNKDGWITEEEWIEWAAPVWYRYVKHARDGKRGTENYPARGQLSDGIRETDVLNVREARENKDEKHLCPLQLGVIERCIKLWSAPGDTVFSPFAGIGSEGYEAIRLGRKFLGIELKATYWEVACKNIQTAEKKLREGMLF